MLYTKYVQCPECNGSGRQYSVYYRRYTTVDADGDDHEYNEPYEDTRICDFCNGDGRFTEEDYLILRLQGKV